MSTLKENVHDLFDGWNTIPNWLSFIRIALIPAFAVLFVQGHQLVAVIVMICAALTDLFDGKIARKFNQVSNLGKLLDPIADKLSQMAIVIVLLYTYWENPIKYLFFFFIVKEVLMLLGGALLLSGYAPHRSRDLGQGSHQCVLHCYDYYFSLWRERRFV